MSKLKRGQVFIVNGKNIIHIAQKWRGGKEKNLFFTQCGKVVSIEDESKKTAYAGCRIVKANQSSCQACNTQYRVEKLAEAQYHREW